MDSGDPAGAARRHLAGLDQFNQVRLVEYAGCLEWPTGADFDPETLHDWPQHVDEMIARRKVHSRV